MESWEELNAMTDEQLVARFNATRANVSVGLQWWLDELVRRRADRATDALVRLTNVLTWLTVILAVLTALSTAAVIYGEFFKD